MNNLQNLRTNEDYFLTLNPIIPIDNKKIIKKVEFTHPFYDKETIEAQKYLSELQGVKNSWFCGSYFGYGFHEDGLKSAINVVNIMNDSGEYPSVEYVSEYNNVIVGKYFIQF